MSGAQVQILLFRSAFMQGVGRFRRDAGAAFLLFRQVAGAVRSHHIAISPWVVLDRAIWQISEGLGNTFAEKLDLLLEIRAGGHVSWSGRHRPALHDLPVPPRPSRTRCPCGSASAAGPRTWSTTPSNSSPPKSPRPSARKRGRAERLGDSSYKRPLPGKPGKPGDCRSGRTEGVRRVRPRLRSAVSLGWWGRWCLCEWFWGWVSV